MSLGAGYSFLECHNEIFQKTRGDSMFVDFCGS